MADLDTRTDVVAYEHHDSHGPYLLCPACSDDRDDDAFRRPVTRRELSLLGPVFCAELSCERGL